MAFATILAVVAGLVISASGAVAHDVWSNIVRKGRDSEHEEVHVARIAAFSIGAIAIVIAILGGEGLNVSFMVGLAFAVAASANFPALLLALTWRRFNTTGAVAGVLTGVISSIGLIIISPTVWPGPDAQGGAVSWYTLENPGIVSVPLGFLACYLGTVLSRESERRAHVRRAVRPLGDRPGRRAGRARRRPAEQPPPSLSGGERADHRNHTAKGERWPLSRQAARSSSASWRRCCDQETFEPADGVRRAGALERPVGVRGGRARPAGLVARSRPRS